MWKNLLRTCVNKQVKIFGTGHIGIVSLIQHTTQEAQRKKLQTLLLVNVS